LRELISISWWKTTALRKASLHPLRRLLRLQAQDHGQRLVGARRRRLPLLLQLRPQLLHGPCLLTQSLPQRRYLAFFLDSGHRFRSARI
jgi:hypothetical protein